MTIGAVAPEQTNAEEDAPSIGDIDTAERFGWRIALITRRFVDGTSYDVERLKEPEFRQQNLRRKESLDQINQLRRWYECSAARALGSGRKASGVDRSQAACIP